MKKETKRRLLWPVSSSKKSCCFKTLLELEFWAKYGSLFIISFSIVTQSYNVIINANYNLSFISIIFNLFFLLIILQKLQIINLTKLNQIMVDTSLKFLIFIFCLNFIMYIFSEDYIIRFLYAPINFLGAYFIFLLLKKDNIS